MISPLIHTSVDDLKSSLRCARGHGGLDMDTLTMARDMAETLGMRTKVKVLEAEMRWVAARAVGAGAQA
jgi:hypothetical protein